jgi:hypothetical protein
MARTPKTQTAQAVAADVTPGTTPSFGLMITINNEPVVITAAAISGLAKNGLSFNYDRDPPQKLGDLAGFIKWLGGAPLNITVPVSDLEGLPIVGSAVTAVIAANPSVNIGRFDVRIQGTDTTQPPSSFTLAGTVTIDDTTKQPKVGPLSFVGVAFGVSYSASS